MNKELKEYTDQELIKEITQRIDNYSLNSNFLVILMVHIGLSYLDHYQKEQTKQPKAKDHD